MFEFLKGRPKWDKPITLGDLAEKSEDRKQAARELEEKQLRQMVREECLAILKEKGLITGD